LSWIALGLLGLLVLISVISLDIAETLLIGLKNDIVASFDWLFVGVASVTLFLVTLIGLHPRARIRLGPDDEKPEFSRFSWFAMLFSAGLASGLLYWAAAEPIIHHQGNPLLASAGIEPASEAAVKTAMRITLLHWGLHGWGMYVLGGLAIAIYSYRHGRPLAIRSALFPILGEAWIDRWPGRAVDLLALLGTVFGVATSIGLSAASLNATLSPLVGLPVTIPIQIAIVFFVCGMGVLSAISGVGRGIRRLSEINLWVSGVFLLAILALGPTFFLLNLLVHSATDYVWTVIPLGLWLGATGPEKEWQSAWTVFYWGWWLAWMPFVSLFIARISKGRTVREFVFAVMGVPTVVITIWMTILGGTAIHQELADPGSLSVAVQQDYSLGITILLENLAAPAIALSLTAIAAFLLFTWLITSLDSAMLVICHLIERPDSATQQILWGTVMAAVTAALLSVGGVSALQAASIIIGLPLAGVTILIGVGLVKDLFAGKL
jgi:choline/glycine/proline betaine transport protein